MPETKILASYIVDSHYDRLPEDVVAEARRAILNYVGCALGGCTEPMDPLHAALMNGISSHVHDYDDTTPGNYSHPSSPVASALFAYAAANRVGGRDFMHAFILGFEAESRVANAVYPAHYDAGWHMTGTAGVFGAAAAIGRLRGLSVQEMTWALGLAATQAAGLREMFGSMAKAFHPGRSAQNGYAAALLAEQQFTAGERGIEGPRGFAPVTARQYDLSKITTGLGVDFDLRVNTYKPFPCGIVNHPTIDGCIQLHHEHRLTDGAVDAVRLSVAPLVLDLCNQQNITRGLQGKFSVYHGAAVGLVRGKAGLREYSDEAVNDEEVKRVRERVTAIGDPTLSEDQARIEVQLADGRTVSTFIRESLGNLKRPMSNEQLEAKFRDQAPAQLSSSAVDRLIELCWSIDRLEDVGEIVRLSVTAPVVATR